jgi:hypothetical protein
MNPSPRVPFDPPVYYDENLPDSFDVVAFANETGIDLFEAAELLSAAVADDFI